MNLFIAESAKISPLADIEASVRGTSIIIGERVNIDAFVKIKAVGGMGDFEIQADSFINSGCVFYTGNGIKIGQNVLIAANCTFAPVNHAYKAKNIAIRYQGFLPSRGGIVIENDVWIGANCVLLDGVIIGKGAVIAAGSIVKGSLNAYTVYGGNPLKVLGERS